MAQQSSFYNTDGTTRTYPSSKHIASKQHVAVYFQSATTGTWSVINQTLYDLVNNSIVFTDAPDSTLYSQIEIRVADTAAELAESPSDIATVAGAIVDVTTVAGSITAVETVSSNIASIGTVSGAIANVNTVATSVPNINTVATNIASVNTVATNIADVTSVADTIVPNIAEILLADDNATTATTQAGIATTKAGEASTSATNAQLSAWESEAEKMTADSYAIEAEDVFVKVYTSNGDGTFTATPTTEYSALHWAAKSAMSAQGDAINISYDNTTSGLTATNVQAMGDELAARSDTHIPLSGLASYHLLSGSLALANSVITNGFATTLYTGNGTTQSVVTGVDMATQWGNSATETFGGLVWLKSRSAVSNNYFMDTSRGVTNFISSNLTSAETVSTPSILDSYNTNGFTLGANTATNANATTFVSWVFQTTHRITGTTNHGKAYTCHYNPFTGFTIVQYEGSGLAGHEIPHHLGRKLGLNTIKNLSAVAAWATFAPSVLGDGSYLYLNQTSAVATGGTNTSNEVSYILGNTSVEANTATNNYILYGWANSYFDEANTLIGNYEIGIYQGTGAAGNKVTTRGKPAWVMIKRLDSTSNWIIIDNKRTGSGRLYPNSNGVEDPTTLVSNFMSDGFTVEGNFEWNISGGQYLYMVVYDNDSGSGRSKYPRATDTSTLNLNAIIPFANGIDASGTKNAILTKNETVSGLTFTEGKNYVYSKNDGTYGVMSVAPTYSNVNPVNGGDFYNVLENKWYTSAGVAITESRNYLDCIVYADAGGQPTYVEQLPKTEYKDIIKANEYQGKNACTAWVLFDMTTTPPTIKDGYGVKTVVRTATGIADIYLDEEMDTLSFTVSVSAAFNNGGAITAGYLAGTTNRYKNKVTIWTKDTGSLANVNDVSVQIYGGRN